MVSATFTARSAATRRTPRPLDDRLTAKWGKLAKEGQVAERDLELLQEQLSEAPAATPREEKPSRQGDPAGASIVIEVKIDKAPLHIFAVGPDCLSQGGDMSDGPPPRADC
jgi:hypothetical protein